MAATMRQPSGDGAERSAMSFFEKLKARFMRCCTLSHPYHVPRPSRLPDEAWTTKRDGQLMNSLYWPKGNTTSCNEPPPFEPNSEILKRRSSKLLSRTTRTR